MTSPLTTKARRVLFHTTLSVLGLAFLSGCASSVDTQSRVGLLNAPQLHLTDKRSTQSATDSAISAQWWTAFGDAQLNGLVEQALTNHPSLQVVQSRIERARAASEAAGANRSPQLNASLDATRQLFSATGMVPPPLAGNVYESGTLQAGASWELDFFGKNRAALEAALGQVQAAQADAYAARTLLASNVARTYFQLIRLHEQLALAQRTVEQRQTLHTLVRSRFAAGLDTQLEVRQSEAALPDARLQVELVQEQIALTRNAMAALIAKPNEPLDLVVPKLDAMHSIAVARSIPIDLLAQRADVAAALQRVQVASHEVDNAQAQFYPNINLVAFAGFSSIGLDRLLDTGSRQWGVGPAIRLPLFDGGRLRANARGKAAERDTAIATYNTTVIDAVRDVADQLASVRAIARQQAEQARSQEQADAAHAIARQRLASGLTTTMNVLAAEATVLAQRRVAVDLAARALDAQVQLIRSLGGGYQDPTTLANRTAGN